MAETSLQLPKIAVYYPYIHFRNDNWLKTAALYWPRMVRIVDPDYPTRNSRLVDVLEDKLNFIVEQSPAAVTGTLVDPLTAFVADLPQRQRAAWTVPKEKAYQSPEDLVSPHAPTFDRPTDECRPPPLEWYGPGHETAGLAGVHRSEIAEATRTLLLDAELAVPARGEWLAMHPELAWIYKCWLTEELASRNNLIATTDQLSAHAVLASPVAMDAYEPSPAAVGRDIATAFGLVAIKTVVPKNLSSIPAEKIVEIRQRFGDEFDRWRDLIDQVGAGLAEQLRDVESPQVLDAYLEEAVKRYVTSPLNQLRRGLNDVGIELAERTINSKFQLPAGGAAAGVLTQPYLAAAGGVALGLVSLRRGAKAKARTVRMSPSAYLLDIQKTLVPKNWLTRITAMMRRTAGIDS
jgi:hypothetical protein